MRDGFLVERVVPGQLMRSVRKTTRSEQSASPLAVSLVVGLVCASITGSLRGGLGFGAGFLGGLTVYLLGAYVFTLITSYMVTRSESKLVAEESRAQLELRIENARAQDKALAAYFDSTSRLLVDNDFDRAPLRSATNFAAAVRGRTLMLLRTLDGERKGHVLTFLYGAGLIRARRGSSRTAPEAGPHEIVDLSGADLSKVNL